MSIIQPVQSIINCENPNEADVVLVGVPFDGTSSFGKGADGGPKAIKECLDRQIEFKNTLTGTIPINNTEIYWVRLPVGDGKYMSERVSGFYQDTINKQFPIMIGGEHSITFPVLCALAKRYDPAKTTVLQIDAHFDLRDTDADYAEEPHGKYAHSCVMRRVSELGFHIVNIGARDYSADEASFAGRLKQEGKLSYFPWRADSRDFLPIGLPIQGHDVYITLDVDGLDPSVMPATGTPVSGGLDWHFTRELLQEVFQKCHVIGADIVEVIAGTNWKQDHAERLTARNAAQLVYDMISLHEQYKK